MIDINAHISGGVHDGAQSVTMNLKDNIITLSLPLTGGSYISAQQESYDLEGVSGGSLNFVQPEMGVTRMEVSLPFALLTQNLNLVQTDSLPNGEQIPTFKSGEHGYLDLDINGTPVRVYISKGHLGIYIEAPFDPYVQVSYPSLNNSDQVIGYYTQIPALAHSQGAFFSSMVLSEETLQNLANQQ